MSLPSSPSPSSSAVTIPTPGKSILKKPPAPAGGLLLRLGISKFLPANTGKDGAREEGSIGERGSGKEALKRAHFILPQIATVYPISSAAPPSTPGLAEEKRAVEERERERRRRVVRSGSSSGGSIRSGKGSVSSGISGIYGSKDGYGAADGDGEWWEMEKVESFYRECCQGCDVAPDPAISAAFKNAQSSHPRTVDFSGVQLTPTSASILADVLTIEWGLRKVVFRECDLDEHTLKPLLHSLLIPNTLTFLSVASNRRLKPPAFRLIAAYMAQSTSLEFLDLSLNPLDKKSIEYIVSALNSSPTSSSSPASNSTIISLRLDDCYLRPAGLEILARTVRTSQLKNISLRHNRLNATAAVALALMIRDYPDIVPPNSPASSNLMSSPNTSFASLSSPPSSLPGSPTITSMPPPKHPSAVGMQTTYTPYVPRSKRRPPVSSSPNPNPLVPMFTSSSQGGVTTRHTNVNGNGKIGGGAMAQGPSAALLEKVRALDALPRVGALQTLDLRGNDLRTGISYLAQVLKRNRTLKVLNLAENKIGVDGLVGVAEALKYNSCLETLDLSRNPCCGPGLEGIQALRTALTLSTSLKRLFLSSTSLSSAGAIALAEFLPDFGSLLHLDLTGNASPIPVSASVPTTATPGLGLAGVLALSGGLKANGVMRCLDLDVPEGEQEQERWTVVCREILGWCVRNCEAAASNEAEGKMGERGGKVWGMIEDSELARSVRLAEPKTVVESARVAIQLGDASDVKRILEELAIVIEVEADEEKMLELLTLHDQLSALASRTKPDLKLAGLGLRLDVPNRSGTPSPLSSLSDLGGLNGYDEGEVTAEETQTPTTPRIDKGKGRAAIEHEKVLSPTAGFLIADSEDSDIEMSSVPDEEPEKEKEKEVEERSRNWVTEEGEVFRKGTVLLGPEEMEGEYAGEELRRELLDAMVERPRRERERLEFGEDVTLGIGREEPPPTPTPTTPTTPTELPARPYLVRSRSSSSSLRSPTTGNGDGQLVGKNSQASLTSVGE